MSVFQPGSHYAFPQAIPEADTAHVTRKMFDLPYAGRSPAQRLDLYWPEASPGDNGPGGSGPYPVILAIHGGAFMGGDKRDVQLKPMLAGLKRGYVVAAVNYRMSGEARFPALVHDIKAAIRWLRAHAGTVPYQQSVNSAARVRALLGDEWVTLELLPGARHADPAFGTEANVQKVLDFLDQSLGA